MNHDDEEAVRFEKALAPCRHCTHCRMTHIVRGIKGCMDATVTAAGVYKQCRCQNFEPKDNLEFLEYRYDKKKRKGK
jgi:hypothetical protein